jgi:hypothetical protein
MAGATSRGLKRRVALRLGDRDMTGVYDNEIYAWLCEAQLEIIGRQPEASIPAFCNSQIWDSTTTPPIVAGTNDYDLPTDFLFVRAVTFNGNSVLHLQRIEELSARNDNLLPTPIMDAGYWWIWGNHLHVDVGTIAITHTLRMFYVSHAPQYLLSENTLGEDGTAMYADTDAMSDTVDPLVSALYWPAMEDYATARGLEQRQSYQLMQFYMGEFDKKLNMIAARFRTNDPMRPEGKPL